MNERDTFAGIALGALLDASILRADGPLTSLDAVARLAYRAADAMIDERRRLNREQLGADIAVARMEAQAVRRRSGL